MAYNDDPYNAPGEGVSTQDPFYQAKYDSVASFYRNALGREGSADEINQWLSGGLPMDQIQTAIYGSPEAQAYNSRSQSQAPTAQPDVTPPTSTPQQTPTSAPAPAAVAPTGPAPYANAPTFQAPSYTPPPAFSYGEFVAPDPNKLDSDPLYRDTLRREQDAIQRSAAARGVLNTGGTIDDLLRNAKDVAATGYANLFNRDLSTYQTNRTNALENYNTNYGTQYQDPYKYNYMGAQDMYNSAQHNYDLGQQYGWYKNLFDFDKEKFGWQQAQDLFNDKYRLLSL